MALGHHVQTQLRALNRLGRRWQSDFDGLPCLGDEPKWPNMHVEEPRPTRASDENITEVQTTEEIRGREEDEAEMEAVEKELAAQNDRPEDRSLLEKLFLTDDGDNTLYDDGGASEAESEFEW